MRLHVFVCGDVTNVHGLSHLILSSGTKAVPDNQLCDGSPLTHVTRNKGNTVTNLLCSEHNTTSTAVPEITL